MPEAAAGGVQVSTSPLRTALGSLGAIAMGAGLIGVYTVDHRLGIGLWLVTAGQQLVQWSQRAPAS